MSLRLYRLDCECPKCERRPARRVTDAGLRGYRAMHPNEIIESVKCERYGGGRSCGHVFWIRARAWHNAVLVEELPGAPDIGPAVLVELSQRQAEVYALVVEGRSDGKIAAALGMKPRSVREYMARTARRLREADATLPNTSPRRVILAWASAAQGQPERALRLAA